MVIATELKEDKDAVLKRLDRTGGQIRHLIRDNGYTRFISDQYYAWAGIQPRELIQLFGMTVSSCVYVVQPSPTNETLLYSEKYVIVPQSEWIKSQVFQVHMKHISRNFSGLDSEKWFFALIFKGCKLHARRLPKRMALDEQGGTNDEWEEKEHVFPAHKTLKTFSDGVKDQINGCREYIKKTAGDHESELTVCPTDYPAIDGATNCQTLYQVTISSKKSVGKKYVEELKHFGASEAKKAQVFFLVPKRIHEYFSISFAREFKTTALKLAEFWVVGIDVMQLVEEARSNR
mmetsp:Transcript_32814/g.79861  ORF Transcript_32814/g.79861 Transcript_32814/m.79861 type:complete len:290 (+) Transcript_32814:1148-2017(+)